LQIKSSARKSVFLRVPIVGLYVRWTHRKIILHLQKALSCVGAIKTASMHRAEKKAALQQAAIRGGVANFLGCAVFAPSEARSICSDTCEYTMAGNFARAIHFPTGAAARFHRRHRTIPPAPVDSAAGPAVACRRAIDPPRPRLLPAIPTAPPRCTETSPPPPMGTRPTLPPRLSRASSS
jgi:hypothetical protein